MPSHTNFTLVLTGGNANARVEIRVMDIFGKTVYQTKGSVNNTYRFGGNFSGGVYMAEILNGRNVVSVKLVKGN